MHFYFLCFKININKKGMTQSTPLPWGLVKQILGGGGALFILTHFRGFTFYK